MKMSLPKPAAQFPLPPRSVMRPQETFRQTFCDTVKFQLCAGNYIVKIPIHMITTIIYSTEEFTIPVEYQALQHYYWECPSAFARNCQHR